MKRGEINTVYGPALVKKNMSGAYLVSIKPFFLYYKASISLSQDIIINCFIVKLSNMTFWPMTEMQ